MDDHIIAVDLAARPAAAAAAAAAPATPGSQAHPSSFVRPLGRAGSPSAGSASPRSGMSPFIEIFRIDPTNPLPTWEIKTEQYRKIIKSDDFKERQSETLRTLNPAAYEKAVAAARAASPSALLVANAGKQSS